jgi:hypothetical protein
MHHNDEPQSVKDTEVLSVTGTQEGASDMVMTMLQQHIPMTLLHDLWSPDGPESWEIFAVESGWLDARSLDRRRELTHA